MTPINVIKCNSLGIEQWRYQGTIIYRATDFIILEAYFDRPDMNLNGLYLAQGDRFVEIYFSDRWYNIFEIYPNRGAQIKGWYCNITTPAVLSENSVKYHDLALDLLVFPDGRQHILDEDEFELLELGQQTKQTALATLKELQELFIQQPSFSILKWKDGH